MAVSLDDLINSLPGSMSGEVMTPQQKQARIDAIVANAMPENLRKYGQTAQQQNESAFGKGMGLSTWNSYQQALNSLAQTEGAGQIRNNAEQQVQQAQNAAIGNAASYATSEKNRQLAAAGQANQATLTHQALKSRSNGQTQGQIYGGLGALASGGAGILGREFKPEISGGLRSLAGKLGIGGAPNQPGAPQTEAAPGVGPAGTGAAGDMSAANSSGYQAPSFASSYPSGGDSGGDISGSYGGYNFDTMPTFTDSGDWNFNAGDLGSLLRSSYNGMDY